MSTSLLYHGFGLKDQEHMRHEFKEGTIIFHVRTKAGKHTCRVCGSTDVVKKGAMQRRFRTVPIGAKPVFIHAHLHRLQCQACGALKLERISFAEEKKDTPDGSPDTSRTCSG